MMSGLRSQRLNTITCVSLRSGIASRRRFLTHQVAAAIAATTTIITRYLFFALNSMIRSTMAGSQGAAGAAGAAVLLNAASADLNRDSESIRKLADVTTSSPASSPDKTS